jgi:hypothetical protein
MFLPMQTNSLLYVLLVFFVTPDDCHEYDQNMSVISNV